MRECLDNGKGRRRRDGYNLSLFQSLRNVLNAIKIDAGNVCSSGQCACPSAPTPCADVIHSNSGNTTDPGVTAMNVEGLAALDRAVNVTDNGRGVVRDCWFHFILRGAREPPGRPHWRRTGTWWSSMDAA